MNGILNILKPPGMTSSDVIVYLRRLLGVKKAGHIGTLDPGACGVLPVCMGKATRLFDYLVDKDKEYIAEITFGITTNTQDQYGEVMERQNAQITEPLIINIIKKYSGAIIQKPSMFSAIKHEGRKMYELARQGTVVEVKDRQVFIHSIDILNQTSEHSWLLRIRCTKGTYIRTLCHDIGQEAGCGAYMSLLIRSTCGPFDIQSAFTLEQVKDLMEKGMIEDALLPMDFAIMAIERADLNTSDFVSMRNGRNISLHGHDRLLRLYYNNSLMGIGQTIDGTCRIKTFLMQE